VCVCVCVSFIQSSTPKTKRERGTASNILPFPKIKQTEKKSENAETILLLSFRALGIDWFPFFIKSPFVLFSLSSEHEMGDCPSNTVNLFPSK